MTEREGRPRRRILQGFVPFVGVAFFVLALVVLHRELATLGYREIATQIRSLPLASLLEAFVLTVLSFAVLSGYEALAMRYVERPLSYRRVAFASFVGYAFSQALGSPLLTGAPLRYRLYSGWGLSAVEVTRMVAFYTATFVLGMLTVVGGVLALQPAALAGSVPLSLPEGGLRVLGFAALACALAYGVWTLGPAKPLRLLSWEFPVPSPPIMTGQVAVGVADWLVAASVLYVLLPAGHGLAFFPFVAVFAVALVLGQVSHVPGGLGVFEAVLLLLLPETVADGSLVASLVAYRGIYYLLPLLLAAGALGFYELRQRRETLKETVGAFGQGISAVVPLALAGLAFLAGMLLLFTGALPLPAGRLAWLGRGLPLPVLEVSHFLGSLVGAGLLVLAWGLSRRLDVAYRLTLWLLAGGVVLSVVRGWGWVQVVVLLGALACILPARREFFRESSLRAEIPSAQWAVLVSVALAGTVWLGLFAYRRVDLSSELWWEFTLRGDAPRFLRATVGVGVFFLVYGLSRLMRPSLPEAVVGDPESPPPEVDAVVDGSDRSHAALVYLGDKRVLLSKSRRAFVMYGVESRSWVSLGDPLGAPDDHDELVWRFRALAFRYGGWPVFYQARPSALPLYVDAGLVGAKLGEEAFVSLDGFTLEGGARKGLRRTVRKVEKEGASFDIIPPGEVPSVLPDLRRISDAWLQEKSVREKGFSLGSFQEGYLRRTPLAVLRLEGRIVAFANVLASGGREELSADLMRYGPGAPASAMEYLFVRLMLWGSEDGFRRFSLGLAPLSGLDTRPLAPLWDRLGAAVFRYGEHFYNFQGLRAYKEKFDPVWEPRYLVSPGGLAFPRVLANVATLIGGGVRGILAR